jgi:hypothetical protein
MSRLEELPPDQRAALSVLLRQRKTYAEVAGMLGISPRAVHDRAHAALAVLAPGPARELDPALRQEIGDYILGQQPGVAERLRTRTLLSSSLPASRWAQALASELHGAGELPEIPPAPAAAPGAPPSRVAGAPAQVPYSLAEAAASPSLWEPPAAPSSRLGGALLLGAILAAAIVVVILVSGGGSSKKTSPNASTATKSTAGKATEAKTEAQFTLKPADTHSRSTGTVQILSEGGKQAFYIRAEHIPATKKFFYAIWLYNSPTSALPLSKSPPVGKSHKLAGAALLPENAAEFHELLLTRETNPHPSHPGHVVLRGPFSLKG